MNITNECTHYSFATDPQSMKKWIEYVAFRVYKLSKSLKIQPMFYGTGFSGVSSIIALSQKLETYKNFPYGFALIRKPYDNTHSDTGKCEMCLKDIVVSVATLWIFVDDFVESGLTFKNSLTAIQKSKLWKEMEFKKIPVSSRGRLMYIQQRRATTLFEESNLSVNGGEYGCPGDSFFKMDAIEQRLHMTI